MTSLGLSSSKLPSSDSLEEPFTAFWLFVSVPSSPLLHFSPTQKADESVVGSNAVHLHLSEAWQINTPTWDSPAIGLGLFSGTMSLLLAFLSVRLRHLRHHLRRHERQVARLSSVDSLTGLANRSRLDQIGTRLLSEQPDVEISLIYIGIDRFKAINDELGYGAGDELLCVLTQQLQACVQPHHTLARVGSDEFALLLSTESDLSLRQIAQQVLAVFAQPFYIQGQSVTVTGSLGISQANNPTAHDSTAHDPTARATEFSQLLNQADIAMSRARIAKTTGQTCCEAEDACIQGRYDQSHYAIFHPFMQAEVRSRAQLQRSLAQALQQQELRVRYQPIVDLRNFQPIGFEALVRWQHPTQGLLVPADFLSLAEEMGLIAAIDRQVMQAACKQLMLWQRRPGLVRPSLSVNLSGSHLNQPDVVDYIQRLLTRYPIAPQQLNVEVTESVMIADPERAIDTLCRIKALGLSISLDDFGTGYSSLCYLHQLPVDVLKIDRFFVNSLSVPDQQADSLRLNEHEVILASIIELAAKLNIRVVAEGIEHPEQLHQLKQMHCTYGQGNLFSKPVSALSAQALLRSGQRFVSAS